MAVPTILGEYLKDSHSVIGIAWWFTTLMTIIAFITSCLVANHADDVDTDLNAYNNYYNNQNNNGNNYNGYNNNNNNNEGSGDYYEWLQRQQLQNEFAMTSRTVQFAAIWTGILALALSFFGLFAVKKNGLTELGIGVLMGCLFLFAAYALVCAFIFGELWVSGGLPEEYRKNREEAGYSVNQGHFKVENSSHAFAVMCFCLAVLNIAFATCIFIYHEKIRGGQGKEVEMTGSNDYIRH